jgi:hypothetical protein
MRKKRTEAERKAKNAAKARRWRAANREKARAISRAGSKKWRAENPEEAKAAHEKWCAENPEKVKQFREKSYKKEMARRKQDPEGESIRARTVALAARYGLTIAQYDAMATEQNGACAICGYVPRGRLHVDHVHDSDPPVVRGLLCRSCNFGIGFLEDSEERLTRAIEYLRRSRTPRLVKQEG